MGKSSAARAEQAEEFASEQVKETITYTPGFGDPTIIEWGGHKFHANVPKELVGDADGTPREKLNMELIERARENKHFVVGAGGKRPRKQAVMIETAEQYRAHLAEWMKETGPDGPVIKSAGQLIERFAKERDMRALAEVGPSDYDLIATIFMPKLHDLAKADELTADQVGQLWRNAGFNELPW